MNNEPSMNLHVFIKICEVHVVTFYLAAGSYADGVRGREEVIPHCEGENLWFRRERGSPFHRGG